MKSIKIKHKEAVYILDYKKRHLLEKFFGVWRLQLTCTNSGKITCDMKWWFYILMFLPLHFLVLISCIWEGGLSAFEIIPRRLHNYTYSGANHWLELNTFWENEKHLGLLQKTLNERKELKDD